MLPGCLGKARARKATYSTFAGGDAAFVMSKKGSFAVSYPLSRQFTKGRGWIEILVRLHRGVWLVI